MPYVLMLIMLCICSAAALEFHSQSVAEEYGYIDGYNEHNETMYNYTSMYCEVLRPSDENYHYNYGYCEGYMTRTVDDMKPE
jgi:hypothetical protein